MTNIGLRHPKMVQIYVLALMKGKYYVGKSNNLESQLEEHFAG
jgi:predicted GIY-YIG superfamily endonuclease